MKKFWPFVLAACVVLLAFKTPASGAGGKLRLVWHDEFSGHQLESTKWSAVPTGGIYSKGKYAFRYGSIEIRAKPGMARGAWPAMWMLAECPYDQPFYILIDQQLGGNWVGEVAPSQLPVEMVVDRVRMYQ